MGARGFPRGAPCQQPPGATPSSRRKRGGIRTEPAGSVLLFRSAQKRKNPTRSTEQAAAWFWLALGMRGGKRRVRSRGPPAGPWTLAVYRHVLTSPQGGGTGALAAPLPFGTWAGFGPPSVFSLLLPSPGLQAPPGGWPRGAPRPGRCRPGPPAPWGPLGPPGGSGAWPPPPP